MSLDGYIGGADEADWFTTHERVLGWVHDLAGWREAQGLAGGEENSSSQIIREQNAGIGAHVMGRRMFDFGNAFWGEDPPFKTPVFILTHRAHEVIEKQGGTSYHFVTDGIESAVRRAREAAGARDILVSGGASAVQAALRAGLIDEFQLHIVPVLLGRGVRLFDQLGDRWIELERTRVVESPMVMHVRYRVVR